MHSHDLVLLKNEYFEGYDKTVNPSAASAFTTSAFRFFIWAWTCSPGFQSSSGLATHCCQHTLSAGQRLTGCKISTEQDTKEKHKNLDVGSLGGRSCPVCFSSRTTFTRWDQILNNCNNCIVLQISVNVSKHRYLFTKKTKEMFSGWMGGHLPHGPRQPSHLLHNLFHHCWR